MRISTHTMNTRLNQALLEEERILAKAKTVAKIKKIIESATTHEHYQVCKRLIRNFERQYGFEGSTLQIFLIAKINGYA